MQVILGIEKVAFVGGDLLETLWMGHYKNVVFDIIAIEHSAQHSNEVVVISSDNESENTFETGRENADHNLNTTGLEGQLEDEQAKLQHLNYQRRIALIATVVTSSSKLRRF